MVTGTLIAIIGICLIPVGAGDAVSDPDTHIHDSSNPRWVLYALGTIVLIVLMQRFLRGFMGTIAVLLGLVIGTAVAWLLGDTGFEIVGEASWVGFTPPFAFGWPRFDIVAIVSLIVVLLVVAVESTGSVFATGEIVGKRIKKEDIAATVRADGLATMIGGSFNSFPYTAFSENVGLVRLTGVKSRWVVAAAGVIMILLGLLPKAAKIVECIPAPVLGGAALIMFATVAVVGIQMLTSVDFTDHRNLIIAATSLAVALYVQFSQSSGPSQVIDVDGNVVDTPPTPGVDQAIPNILLQIPFSTGITMGAITAILLNLLFFHVGRRGPAVAGAGSITLDEVNEMSLEKFRETFGHVVQDVDWVLDRAYAQRPFEDVHDLRSAFQEAMLTGNDAEQLELIQAFPDLGGGGRVGRDGRRRPCGALAARRGRAPERRRSRDRISRALRFPARHLRPRGRTLRPRAAQRLVTHGQLGEQREVVRAHRDREDREPPVRRSRRRRQPAHVRPVRPPAGTLLG